MAQNTRYFAEVGTKKGRIHKGDPEKSILLNDLHLSPDDSFTLRGQTTTLGTLLNALINYDEPWLTEWFDDRGQLDTGRFLYKQLFGEKRSEALEENGSTVEVRIVTQDENVSRLPWMLLAHHGVFLSTAGWGVSLANVNQTKDCELPPLPKILVMSPQPASFPKTEADEHVSQLQDMLAAADLAQTDNDHFRRVASWSKFLEQLDLFQPDILYYYGHGEGDEHSSSLAFEDRSVPLADLRLALNSAVAPLLAYINCCQGDAGGLLGAGKQLVDIVPAVLTNRTVAYVDAAQKQGLAFWEAILVRGEAPHIAVAKMRGRMSELGLSTKNTRWMTPVLHCQYGGWRSTPPQLRPRSDRDPHWQLKLDRIKQFSQVFFQVHQMLMECKPRAIAYLWYGSPDQGVKVFHERLTAELKEKLDDTDLYEIRPEWPDDLEDPQRSFEDMIFQACDIQSLEHLPGRIRTHGRQVSGRRILVYVCHRPVNSELVFHPQEIKLYLQWWNNNFVPRLPENAYALLGISYETKNPANLYKYLSKKEKLHELTLSNTLVELLDELEKVTRRDLTAFIQTHNIDVPEDIQDDVLSDILKRTQGSYLEILDIMRELESIAWRERRKKTQAGDSGEKDYGDLF